MTETLQDYGIEIPAGASGQVDAKCPRCSSQRKKSYAKCLSVNVTEGVWYCQHCNWSDFLKKPRAEHRTRTWRKPAPRPEGSIPQRVVDWFAKRGIPESVLRRNRVSYERTWFAGKGECDAIAFPYYRGGELVNRKYRTLEKDFTQEKGAEQILFGLDDVQGDELVWTEGEIDKLSVETAGFVSAVSVPNGAPAEATKDYSAKFAFLDTAKERLEGVRRHVLAVDADRPGRVLEDELARRLGRERCWRVVWPEGCKDANEVLVKHGAEELRWYIEHAEQFPIEGTFTVRDLNDKIDHLYAYGFTRGLSTGWEKLDRNYTVRPGELTVVTGIPGSGKSNWLDALLVNLAELHGWSFAIFSPENQPLEEHMARVIEKWARVPFTDGPTERMDQVLLAKGKEWANGHFTWILPSDEIDWSIDTVLQKTKEIVFRRGVRGAVIDPWNELEHLRPPTMNETEYVSVTLKKTRQFARAHGVHVWLVVHPAKLYREKQGGNYPVPTLYDCSGSAHFRNKADNGIVIWRNLAEPDTRAVDIHVQKIRFRSVGRLGMVTLYYDPATATYSAT